MIVSFHPYAKDELFNSAFHYESKLVGLGSEFRSEVKRGTQVLAEHPRLGREIDEEVFRLVLRKFPYSLVYSISDTEVLILAVAHHRQNPGYWNACVDA